MSAREVLAGRKDALTGALDLLLRATAFDNPYSLHPRRLAEIGSQLVDRLLHFLETRDSAAALAFGGQVAKDGLGERTVLKLTALARTRCRHELAAGPPETAATGGDVLDAVEAFTTSLLEGFVGAWKAEILSDQERLRKAVADAIAGS